jgi:hypothetical protein
VVVEVAEAFGIAVVPSFARLAVIPMDSSLGGIVSEERAGDRAFRARRAVVTVRAELWFIFTALTIVATLACRAFRLLASACAVCVQATGALLLDGSTWWTVVAKRTRIGSTRYSS